MSEIAQGMVPIGAGPDLNGSAADRRVFLAEATYDLREKRDVIRRELSDWGFRVFPEKNFPLVSPEIEKGTRESLSECKLSVHLIGENYGVIPEAGLDSLIELQNAVASSFSKESGLERIIWIPPGLQPADERQRGFLERIQTDQEAQFGAEIYQMPLETFKSALQEKLKNLEKKEAPAVEVNGSVGEHTPMVYLICDQDDIDAVTDLEDFLFDQGFDVMLPIFEGEESQVRLDHQENLKEADAVIVYYGQSNDLWIRAKLRDFKKIPGYGRIKPLLHKYVYVSNSAGGRAARVRAQGVTVLQEEEQFEGKVFDPMIRQLKTSQQDA